MKYRNRNAAVGHGLAVALTLLLLASSGMAAGRWMTHIVSNPPEAGTVGKPVDTISAPETAGHWVWLVWYDAGTGTWVYNQQSPYCFSYGSVTWQIPEYNQWYYLMLYDTATGQWY